MGSAEMYRFIGRVLWVGARVVKERSGALESELARLQPPIAFHALVASHVGWSLAMFSGTLKKVQRPYFAVSCFDRSKDLTFRMRSSLAALQTCGNMVEMLLSANTLKRARFSGMVTPCCGPFLVILEDL